MVSPIPNAQFRQCTAKSKRSGERCKHAAMVGRDVCHMHGGKSLVGPASPRFSTGRYSRLLPARLAATYRKAVSDPDLLAMRQDIALVDARLAELLKKLDTGEAGAIWAALGKAWGDLNAARRAGDTARMAGLMATIGELIERGAADGALWAEIAEQLYLRRRLVESERKRLVELQQLMTAEQAMVLVAAVMDSVRRNVADRATLAAISADIARLVSAEGRGDAGPGGGGE